LIEFLAEQSHIFVVVLVEANFVARLDMFHQELADRAELAVR